MPLASANEPLMLADGTIVEPNGRVRKPAPTRFNPVPSNTEAQRTLAKANRRLADLPALPAQLNVISVVMCYSLWGLSDQEIAIATNLSADQVQRVRAHEAYSRMQQEVVTSVIEQDSASVRDLLAKHAHDAAHKVIGLMNSEDDVVSLRASTDILDRAGHRPADVVEHRHTLEGGLRIEYITRDDTVKLPTIDLSPE